jgi:hypothetical protein
MEPRVLRNVRTPSTRRLEPRVLRNVHGLRRRKVGRPAINDPGLTNALAEQRYQTLADLLVGRAWAERVRGSTEWVGLLALAQAEGVDPLFHRVVSALPGAAVPAIVSEMLSTTYLDAVQASLIYESTRTRLCRRLSERRISVLLLKGAALAFTYYDDPATRAMNDLDVLIPAARLDEAAGCLEEDGFTFLGGSQPAQLRRAPNHAICVHSLTGITVELHWQLDALSSVQTAGIEEIWSGAQPAPFEPNAQVMRAGHLVPYLCAHMAVQHKRAQLMDLYDLHRVLRAMASTEAEVVRDTAIRWGLAACVGLALQRVRRLLGTPLPGVLETWSDEPATRDDLQARVAALALAPDAGEMPNGPLLDLAMGRNGQPLLRLLYRFLFPPLTRVRQQLGLAAEAPVTPMAYLAVTGQRLLKRPADLRRFWSFWRAAQKQRGKGQEVSPEPASGAPARDSRERTMRSDEAGVSAEGIVVPGE